jgi:4-amino-4-deoxy-L-arabinose transferase-like glycosyltransferase
LWIGKGDFYTKGEPREASVSVSMIEKNKWILPDVYAGEIAYKPPFTHWLAAVFSLPQGKVTPFSSRLPSALAFMGLIVFSFLFFGKNLKFQHAFLTALILITSFELHRAAMTSRVDMMLTFLIVLALIRLFRWEERKQLNGFPVLIVVIMGLAALTKGPVGVVLPLLVFGIYLLLLRYNFWKIVGKLFPLFIVALIPLLVWYVLAYQTGGKEFSDIVWAENFSRFFRTETPEINYYLGHTEPWWYNFITLFAGFIPWTILLFISLFGLRYSKRIPGIRELWRKFTGQEKINLFSAVAAGVIILFYCIPSSKRSVYIMPAYPFIAVFIAQYVLYLAEYKPTISKIFNFFIGTIACLVGLIVLLTVTIPIIDPVALTAVFSKSARTLDDVARIWQSLSASNVVVEILLTVLVFSISLFFIHFRKKNFLKTLYSTIGVYLAIFLVVDGVFLPAYKNGISPKSYAKSLQEKYSFSENNNLFVMNKLTEYSNMYGLNFYMNNCFRNFETEAQDEGYFLVGSESFEKVLRKYGEKYRFDFLEEYQNPCRDGERIIRLYYFKRVLPLQITY